MFTGEQAFEAAPLEEALATRSSGRPRSPSGVTPHLDPSVEKVILRCLDPDPAERPASAMMVAAALPGGDPLEAALAAGETPSPALVAAAGERGRLTPLASVLAFAGFACGMALSIFLFGLLPVGSRISLEKFDPPEVLRREAQEILGALGGRGR